MIRRVRAAGIGGLACATLAAAAVAVSPVRPSGLLLALVLIGGLTPLTALVGTRVGLRLADQDDAATAARLAAMTSPPLVLVAVFAVDLAAGSRHPGAQQLAALVIGTTTAAALSARFTGAAAQQEEQAREEELLRDVTGETDPPADDDAHG